jgi:hypothetical protein
MCGPSVAELSFNLLQSSNPLILGMFMSHNTKKAFLVLFQDTRVHLLIY